MAILTFLASVLFSFVAAPGAAQNPAGYVVVASYPHDSGAFTQGLDFDGGRFLETTGLNGQSALRHVDLETGEVLAQTRIAERFFGEGMTVIKNGLWWITWQNERAFLYDPDTFEHRRSVRYRGEGWGLTHNGRRLVMSNGTATLAFRDPRTFKVTRRVKVTDNGNPVDNLNELEWVNGEVFANVWPGDQVARIDPGSGEVTGWLDLTALKAQEQDGEVTNGIAYLKRSDRLFVTGKNWSHVYEIELTD